MVYGFAVVALVAACASTSSVDEFDVIRSRQANADYELAETVPELLAEPSSHLTVLEGTIDEVEPGVGMHWTVDELHDDEQRHVLDFYDDAALVRSVHVSLAVGGVIVGTWDEEFARFGLVVDSEEDAELLADGLTGKSVVVFLDESAVWGYEPDLYGVAYDGGLLCQRGTEQPLECPGLVDGLARGLDIESVTDDDIEPTPPEIEEEDDAMRPGRPAAASYRTDD